jgi:hypothetical protein
MEDIKNEAKIEHTEQQDKEDQRVSNANIWAWIGLDTRPLVSPSVLNHHSGILTPLYIFLIFLFLLPFRTLPPN